MYSPVYPLVDAGMLMMMMDDAWTHDGMNDCLHERLFIAYWWLMFVYVSCYPILSIRFWWLVVVTTDLICSGGLFVCFRPCMKGSTIKNNWFGTGNGFATAQGFFLFGDDYDGLLCMVWKWTLYLDELDFQVLLVIPRTCCGYCEMASAFPFLSFWALTTGLIFYYWGRF